MGVEELTDGRLRAAGSMSGMLDVVSRNGEAVARKGILGAMERDSERC
jgi:hypothetical protein